MKVIGKLRPPTLPGLNLSRHKDTLIAWMAGWAAFTYGSAAIRWLQVGDERGVVDVAVAIFRIADGVPPYAKLLFGFSFLLGLYLLPRLSIARKSLGLGAAAGGVAGMIVLFLAPLDYFTGAPGSFLVREGVGAFLPHLAVAIGAGLLWAEARRRYARRSGVTR